MAPKQIPDDDVVNVAWVANTLDCTAATVTRYITDGKLPQPFKLGRSRLWFKSDLMTFLRDAAKGQSDD